MAFQERSVGGQGEVEVWACIPQQFHQGRDVLAQQRLSSREAHLSQASGQEALHHGGDLLVRQECFTLKKGMVAIEVLSRHAVRATEVASVRDRNAEVVEWPFIAVHESHESFNLPGFLNLYYKGSWVGELRTRHG